MSLQDPVPPPRSSRSQSRSQSRNSHTSGTSRTMSANVRRLHDSLNKLLDDHDRAYFVHALNEYNSRRNVYSLVQNLQSILDTPEKKQLYLLLGKVVPTSDQALYWQHAEPLYNIGRTSRAGSARTKGNGRKSESQVNNGDTKHYFDTMPTRTRPPLPPEKVPQQQGHGTITRNGEPHGKTVRRSTGNSWASDQQKDLRRIVLKKSHSLDGELGFSIRGGSEHSVGIFISMVEPRSMAEEKGMQSGDQIMQVNDIPFEKITHAEAVKVLKSSKKLTLYIKSVGRVPGSFVTHQTYTWVDPQGRSVSPPPDVDQAGRRLHESHGRKSALNLLKDGDEKKVNLVISDGHSLGLMIRGGHEFGLGIYLTGVDNFSVADEAGLKVGDQILDVNGRSFLDIDHQEAVNILKSSKLMMMTVKDVGKLPYARTTIDRTQWIMGDEISVLGNDISRSSSRVNGSMQNGDVTLERRPHSSASVFSRGIAGSQMMYNSAPTGQAWSMIEDQAKHLLNENEKGTMMYYLGEYQRDLIDIDALVQALFELFSTHAKFSLLSEIRAFVIPRDIDRFDSLVLKREVESMKARQQGFFLNERENSIGETFSSSSHYSSGSIDSRPITPPHVPAQLPPNIRISHDHHEDRLNGLDSLHINEDTIGLPDFSLPDFSIDSTPPTLIRPRSASSPSQKSPRSSPNMSRGPLNLSMVQPTSQQTVIVDVHRHSGPSTSQMGRSNPEPLYASIKSPSEDSGVDMYVNGSINSGRSRNGESVTISPTPPVTINESTSDMESPRSSLESPKSDDNLEAPVTVKKASVQRRLSLDSISTEGSSAGHPTSPRRISLSSDGIPRRISDPTHHVPRDQRRNVEQTRKATQQLLELRRQSSSGSSPSTSAVTSPTTPNAKSFSRPSIAPPPPPPPQRSANTVITTKLERPVSATKTRDRGQGVSRVGSKDNDERSSTLTRFNGHMGGSTPTKDNQNRRNSLDDDDEDEDNDEFMDDLGTLKRKIMVNVYDDNPEGAEWISVRRTKPNLGIAVEGGAGTRQPLPKIIKIQYGGSAYHNSNLKVGHVILKVNEKSLRSLHHQQATRVIAEAFKNKARDAINFLVIDTNRYQLEY